MKLGHLFSLDATTQCVPNHPSGFVKALPGTTQCIHAVWSVHKAVPTLEEILNDALEKILFTPTLGYRVSDSVRARTVSEQEKIVSAMSFKEPCRPFVNQVKLWGENTRFSEPF